MYTTNQAVPQLGEISIQIANPSTPQAYTGCTQESFNQSLGTLTNNQISGWCYDASGNLLAETTCPTGPPYAYMYDAENHLTSTAGVTYTYDGDGKNACKNRAGCCIGTGWAATRSMRLTSTGTITDEYIFFGGKRIARRDPSNNVVYYFADHLGTSRIVANAAGTILGDSDFYPFGGQRLSSWRPLAATPTVYRQRTRFGIRARLLWGTVRRFDHGQVHNWHPDWSSTPAGCSTFADPANPQSLNLYSMS